MKKIALIWLAAVVLMLSAGAGFWSLRFLAKTKVSAQNSPAGTTTNPSAPTSTNRALQPQSASVALPTSIGLAPATNSGSSHEFDPAVNPYAGALKSPGVSKRAWDPAFLEQHSAAKRDQPIRFELVSGIEAAGIIRIVLHDAQGVKYMSGELTQPDSGNFFFLRPPAGGKAGQSVGIIELPRSKTAYRIEPTGPNGAPELWQRRLDEVRCVSMPLQQAAATAETNRIAEAPPLRPDAVPDYIPPYNTNLNNVPIISLQSLPGAEGVLLLHFFGGSTPTWDGVTWPAPNLDNARIKDIWKRVAEDYMPFHINVTTDMKVYEAAPQESRQMCVFTPGSASNPMGQGGAGVAYFGSWNWGSDTPCWSGYGYSDAKGGAEVASHEVGHTLGLGHDTQDPAGGTHVEYYGGHGDGAVGWAPIMGVGYYKPVTTWSSGEYQYAGNHQDDLNVVTTANNNTPYRGDDTGNLYASSRYLEIYSNFTASAEGVIETTGDADAFRFRTTGGSVSLTANPVGDWADLALTAMLINEAGAVIVSNSPQPTLSAGVSASVAAGNYAFRVSGAGRNNPLTDGFSSYASLGYYSVTGSVANAELPNRFSVAENSVNGTAVGTITSTNLGVDPLVYTIVSGNTSNAFAIGNNGMLTVANPLVLNYETLASKSQFTVQFELLVNIIDTTNPARTELNRRVVVQVLDVNETPVLAGTTNYVLSGTMPGTAISTVLGSDPDLFTILNYSIIGGNASGLFAIGASDGVMRLAATPTAAHVGAYNLTVRAADTSAASTTANVRVNVVLNSSSFSPQGIVWDVYDGMNGSAVGDLTGSSRFPNDPSFEKFLLKMDSGNDRADNYGSVMRGFVIPPVTGNYTFYIASDDNGELRLSPDTNSANAVKIAWVVGAAWTDRFQWDKFPTQRSPAQFLSAGQAYYIEARQKENAGGDLLQVAWVGPHTGGKTSIITAPFLAPATLNYTPGATGFTANVRRDAIQGFRIGRVQITDLNPGQELTCAILSGNGSGIFAVDDEGWVSVANAAVLASTPTTNFSLQIRVMDNGIPALSRTTTVGLTIVPSVDFATEIRREMFLNIAGGSLTALTSNHRYPNRPDRLDVVTRLESARDVGDSYGSRVRAFLVPPSSGQYQFWLSADNAAVLNLSSGANPANSSTIASVPDGQWSDPDLWTTFPSQTSGLINLIAGQKYYIEVVQKEDVGGDFLQAAWSGPGLPAGTNIISGTYLQPVDLNLPPTVANISAVLPRDAANGASVTVVPASDSPLDSLSFHISSGNPGDAFNIDPSTGEITVADNAGIADGTLTNLVLTVLVQDSGLGGLYALRTNSATVNITVLPAGSMVAGMTHRYSFAANPNDSLGAAHGALNGGASISGGRANFDGISGFISLPGGILSGYRNASFEAWMTIQNNGSWPELFAFGQHVSGSDNGYIAFIPRSASGDYRLSYNPGSEFVITGPSGRTLDNNVPVHVTGIYDQTQNRMSIYTNGLLAGTAVPTTPLDLTSVRTNYAYIGKSLYPDPFLKGTVDEFRIWNTPVSPLQVALNSAAGPNLIVDSSAKAVRLTAAPALLNAGETRQVQVYVDFNQLSNLLVTTHATGWISSDASVLQVTSNGMVRAIHPGTATVSATVAGLTSSLSLSVNLTAPSIVGQPRSQARIFGQTVIFTVSASGGSLAYQWRKNGANITAATTSTLKLTNVGLNDNGDYSVVVSNARGQEVSSVAQLAVIAPALLHRWTFSSNTGIDSVGGANATLLGAASYSNGKLQLPGGATARANCATVNISSTLASSPSATIEAWFSMNALQDWSKIWMFGSSNGGQENGLSYIEFTPRAGAAGNVPSLSFNSAVGTELNTRGGANPAAMTTGTEYHVVTVFDAASSQARLYINGVLADTASLNGGDLAQLNATEAYFGAAVYYDDPNLNGAINEIRIWNAPLPAALVAANFNAGPNDIPSYVPPVTLTINAIAGVPTITWSYGVLEEADDLSGPWSSVSGASSPYSPAPSEPKKFYRVRVN